VKKLLILAMVLSALLIGMPAVAVAETTHNVTPGDDIQAAIDTASPGDTIVFALGIYSLSSTLNVNKALTLTSEDPYAATKPVIDGGSTLGMIIYIAADDVTLDGLEVANGTSDLIYQSGAHSGTTIRNCVVHDSSGDEGIQLKSCTNCLVECNLVYDVAEDGISIADGSHNSVISNNEIYNVGSENAAIYVYDSYDMTVACNHIHDTPAANGIKMYKNYGGTHIIANNLIVHNNWQGGKRCYDEADGSTINIYKPRVASTYVVKHNTLADNTGVDACGNPTGHAIYVNDYDGSGFVTNVDDNIATNHNGYGIRVFFGAAVNYSHNDLWQNALGATDGNPVDGGDNIYEDPLYNTGYTLQVESPCIDAASDGKDMGVLFDECGCAPANTVPVADANGPYLVAVEQSVALDGSGSSDPDGDPLSESWVVTGDALGTIAGSTFTAGTVAGITEVTLTVDDGKGGTATDTAMVVIYDPSGGFVTGGGWFYSDPGAYVPAPSLEGKATFGFVAKYKKGANMPDGNTEFQFKAADLNFHSSSYEWLVVAGPHAKFKGVGTINGSGEYGFMLTATDSNVNGGGDVDGFRIKIWDKANGDTVVYDNKMGQGDDSNDTTALGGGSIVIHKK
jgi:parallel beta-helix repeat protein